MQIVRTIGCVILGILIGTGAMLSWTASAQTPAQATDRIAASPIQWAGGQGFRYVRDSATRKCYFATVSRTADVTAMVEAPTGGCSF